MTEKQDKLSPQEKARADVMMSMYFQGTLNDQTMPKEKMKIFLEQPFSQWPKEMQDQLKPYGADEIE